MDWLTAAVGVGGILLGGGLKAMQTWWERRLEARAVLNTLVAEIDTIRRLANARGYIRGLVDHANYCRALVNEGRGGELVNPLIVPVQDNYFQAFDALVGKIGLLKPHEAGRIIRFYMLIKSVKENVASTSIWGMGPHGAEVYLPVLDNDLEIMRSAFRIAGQVGIVVDQTPTKDNDPIIGGPEPSIEEQLHLDIDSRFATGLT